MLYRIDAFNIPDAVRPEFERRALETTTLLRTQPGFVSKRWFEKVFGDGSMNLVTMVEWQDEASIRAAGQAVHAMHAAKGFDPAAFARLNGIVDSKAVYRLRDTGISA